MVSVLQRFRSQHTLGNAPIMFVYGAIVASNAVLITSRHAGGNGTSGPALKNTHFPALDLALSEMSVSWELAGQARNKFRAALSMRQQKLQEQLDQQLHRQLSATFAGQEHYDQTTKQDASNDSDVFLTEPATLPPAMVAQETLGQHEQGTSMDGVYNWDDPLNIDDGSAAYWADLDTDFFVGWDAQNSTGLLDAAEWNQDS